MAMSHRFLDFVEQRGIAATAFIVGEISRSHPQLVRRVAEGGHEVAPHGLRHVALDDVARSVASGVFRFPSSVVSICAMCQRGSAVAFYVIWASRLLRGAIPIHMTSIQTSRSS